MFHNQLQRNFTSNHWHDVNHDDTNDVNQYDVNKYTVCNIQIQNTSKFGDRNVMLHTVQNVLNIATKFKQYEMINVEYKKKKNNKTVIIEFKLKYRNQQKLKNCLNSITNEVNRLLSRHITIKQHQYSASYFIPKQNIKTIKQQYTQNIEPGQIFETRHEQKYNNNNQSQYQSQYQCQYEPGATKQGKKYNPYDFVEYSDDESDDHQINKTKTKYNPYDYVEYTDDDNDDDETNNHQTTTTTTTTTGNCIVNDILDQIQSVSIQQYINLFIPSPQNNKLWALIKDYDSISNKLKILDIDDKEHWIKCDKSLKSQANVWSFDLHQKLTPIQSGFYILYLHNKNYFK